jgi:hypothetical protein
MIHQVVEPGLQVLELGLKVLELDLQVSEPGLQVLEPGLQVLELVDSHSQVRGGRKSAALVAEGKGCIAW